MCISYLWWVFEPHVFIIWSSLKPEEFTDFCMSGIYRLLHCTRCSMNIIVEKWVRNEGCFAEKMNHKMEIFS
jgi:hypothetical protein